MMHSIHDSNENGIQGTVSNIERYTLHDGPGIRTTVFLKGCPLRCLWCSNPESQESHPEIIYIKDRCSGCGRCLEVCEQNAIVQESEFTPVKFLYDLCNGCGLCVEQCAPEALTIAGKEMTAEAVCEVAARDILFYKHSQGGITLSGGEPLAQPEFSAEVLRLCQQKGIHTAIQTCGYAPINNLKKVVPFIDLIIYDIKHMNDKEHKRLTGVSNKLILENLRFLSAQRKRIIIQMALIPGFNDSAENMRAVFDLVKSLQSVEGLSLLSYHTLGVAKYHRLGREYQLPNLSQTSKAYLEKKMNLAENYGVSLIRFN